MGLIFPGKYVFGDLKRQETRIRRQIGPIISLSPWFRAITCPNLHVNYYNPDFDTNIARILTQTVSKESIWYINHNYISLGFQVYDILLENKFLFAIYNLKL